MYEILHAERAYYHAINMLSAGCGSLNCLSRDGWEDKGDNLFIYRDGDGLKIVQVTFTDLDGHAQVQFLDGDSIQIDLWDPNEAVEA